MATMKLIEYMTLKNLNAAEMGRTIGVPRSTVHRWIHGTRFPTLEYIKRITRETKGKVRAEDFFDSLPPPKVREPAE